MFSGRRRNTTARVATAAASASASSLRDPLSMTSVVTSAGVAASSSRIESRQARVLGVPFQLRILTSTLGRGAACGWSFEVASFMGWMKIAEFQSGRH
jgi:hypothetical protein